MTVEVTKITYTVDSPDDRLLVKRGSVATIHYKTATGQEDQTMGVTPNLELVARPGTKLAKSIQEHEAKMKALQDPVKEI